MILLIAIFWKLIACKTYKLEDSECLKFTSGEVRLILPPQNSFILVAIKRISEILSQSHSALLLKVQKNSSLSPPSNRSTTQKLPHHDLAGGVIQFLP